MSTIEKILYYLLNEYYLKDFVEHNHIQLIYDAKFKKFANLLIEFYKKYDKVPNIDEFQKYVILEESAEELCIWFIKYEKLYVTENYQFLIDELRNEYKLKGWKHIVETVDPNTIDLRDIAHRLLKAQDKIEISSETKKGFIWEDLDKRLKRIDDAYKYAGIPTGFEQFDDITDGGWNKKELYLFFAMSSAGKSTILFNIAYNLVDKGYWGIYFTLEMHKEQMERIFDSRIGNISNKLIKHGKVDIEYYKDILSTIEHKKPPLFNVEHTGDTDVAYIEREIKEFKKEFPLDFIVIDYIGCMEENNIDNDAQKLKYISKCLKNIAKKEDIMVFTAEQTNRDAYKDEKDGKEIGIEHMAQSYWIAAYCDVIAYVKKCKLEKDTMEIKFIKNREGKVSEFEKGARFSIDWTTKKMEDLIHPSVDAQFSPMLKGEEVKDEKEEVKWERKSDMI
jgi:KaiC/GvpD/RAD55 family RecA-like ATPase